MRQLLLALALSFTSAMAADSQMFRGHPSLSGVTPPPGKPLEGKIAWSSATMGWELYQPLENMDGQAVFPSTPAVVGGRIYLCAGPYHFVFDAAGQPVYHVKLSACTLASPTVVDGLVYVSTDDGRMHAVEAKDGKERWTAVIGANPFMKQVDNWDVYHSSATVVDGVLYVGSADGRIYALSAANGKELWHFQTGHVVRATPAVVAGRVYCGSFDGKVYALDAATGSKLWEVDTATKGTPWHAVQGSCAVVDGTVYVGSRSGFLYAIDAATGKVRWQESHDGNWVPSSPAVRDGIAYVGQSDGHKVTAVSPDGKVLWRIDAPNETFASPLLAGDILYVAGNDNYNQQGKGSLCALEAKTGKVVWKLELPASVWASPVLVDGTLYAACADGKLYAIR